MPRRPVWPAQLTRQRGRLRLPLVCAKVKDGGDDRGEAAAGQQRRVLQLPCPGEEAQIGSTAARPTTVDANAPALG